MNEFSSELLECAAYFFVSAQCIENHPDPRAPKLASDYRSAAEKLTGIAITTGRSVGISDDAFAARTRLTFAQQMKSINNNCINVSVLLDRYSDFCMHLSRTPDQRLDELTAGKFCTGTYYKCEPAQ